MHSCVSCCASECKALCVCVRAAAHAKRFLPGVCVVRALLVLCQRTVERAARSCRTLLLRGRALCCCGAVPVRQVLVVLPGGDIVAKLCNVGTTNSTSSLRRVCPDGGSAYYLPQGGEVVSPKGDVYSLTVMVAEVVLQHMEVCWARDDMALVSNVPPRLCPAAPTASAFACCTCSRCCPTPAVARACAAMPAAAVFGAVCVCVCGGGGGRYRAGLHPATPPMSTAWRDARTCSPPRRHGRAGCANPWRC